MHIIRIVNPNSAPPVRLSGVPLYTFHGHQTWIMQLLFVCLVLGVPIIILYFKIIYIYIYVRTVVWDKLEKVSSC